MINWKLVVVTFLFLFAVVGSTARLPSVSTTFARSDSPGTSSSPESSAPQSSTQVLVNSDPYNSYWDDRFQFPGLGPSNDVFGIGVKALSVIGDDVYVGGHFQTAGHVTVNNIAKWNGREWDSIGIGVQVKYYGNAEVDAIAPSGSDIYIGGNFDTSGTTQLHDIAKWDDVNQQWVDVGGGLRGKVKALAVIGNDVYAGGEFTTTGSLTVNYIARWDGTNWNALDTGANSFVYTLAVSGTILYVGGAFTQAGNVSANHIAQWDTQTNQWSALGDGAESVVGTSVIGPNGSLYASGTFSLSGGNSAYRVAQWDGNQWSDLGVVSNGGVYAMTANENDVYIDGTFTSVDGITATYLAKWDAVNGWSEVGNGADTIFTMVYAFGVKGNQVFVSGDQYPIQNFYSNRVAMWDGTQWNSLGQGLSYTDTHSDLYSEVLSIGISGTHVYVGGDFERAEGLKISGIAEWNGTRWNSLGNGIGYGLVRTMIFSGTGLYVGGYFSQAGNTSAKNVAKWDIISQTWSTLGTAGITQCSHNYYCVSALTRVGNDLFAGGMFTAVDGQPMNNIARWDGNAWAPLAGGVLGCNNCTKPIVSSLANIGDDLYVGGYFTSTNGNDSIQYLAKWNVISNTWSNVGGSINGAINAMAVQGDNLIIAGGFTQAGGMPVHGLARWDGQNWTDLGVSLNTRFDQYIIYSLAVDGNDFYIGGSFRQPSPYVFYGVLKCNGAFCSTMGSGSTSATGYYSGFVRAIGITPDEVYVGGSFDIQGDKLSYRFGRWVKPPAMLRFPFISTAP